EEIFLNPRAAYENALKDFGHIVAVQRKGRLEYIVDDTLTHEVLTSNSAFSFEEGTATILNLHYFYRLSGSFFEDLDDLVRNGIVARMSLIVEQVFPIFLRHTSGLMGSTHNKTSSDSPALPVDIFDLAHKSISEAMTLTILGPKFVTERNLAIVEKVAKEIAELTGLYQNRSLWARSFPGVWKLVTWTRVIVTSIVPFFFAIGPQVWEELHPNTDYQTEFDDEDVEGSVLEYLSRKNLRQPSVKGRMSMITTFLRVMSLILGIVFASVHQTASVVVWIVFEIAARPEYIPALRDEMISSAAVDPITKHPAASYEALQNAEYLDSFVREVMRTKGDTLSTCRKTTQDVTIGEYKIPKGFLVIPMATLSHSSTKYHGADAAEFNGERWVSTGKQAVKLSTSYFPFGLGRWACPGRVLAVAGMFPFFLFLVSIQLTTGTEIKMIVWAILCQATPILEGNSYRIVDPLNTTSVPPEGNLMLLPLDG
ncbi:cytochrome P450, partial [Phellopilus nigrolimitatus]